MNIFTTCKDPISCAEVLDDKRLVKMVLETAQILSTSMIVCGDRSAPYKVTHKNHPCCVWARTTQGNYNWLLQHFAALLGEYEKRFERRHKCEDHYGTFVAGYEVIPQGPLQEFANCSRYKDAIGNEYTFNAYKRTMLDKWSEDLANGRPPRWNKQVNTDFKNKLVMDTGASVSVLENKR